MGNCCGGDQRPYMKIKVLNGENISAEDDDGESDAFILFSYGSLEHNRFVTRETKAVETHKGRCEWNQEFRFVIGSIHSTQSLKVELKDYNLVESNSAIGKEILHYGSHPLNPDIPEEDDKQHHHTSSRRDSQISSIPNKEDYKYFLPMLWNEITEYKLEMKDKNGGLCGNIYLEITMINPTTIPQVKKPLIENTNDAPFDTEKPLEILNEE